MRTKLIGVVNGGITYHTTCGHHLAAICVFEDIFKPAFLAKSSDAGIIKKSSLLWRPAWIK